MFFKGFVLFAIVVSILTVQSITAEEIVLEEARKDGDNSLLDTLSRHHPTAVRQNSTLNRDKLIQLLWSMQGLTHPPARSVPSAGGTYPLDVYCSLSQDIDGIDQGLYHYLPNSHSLDFVRDKVHTIDLLESFNISTQEYGIAPVMFVVTAEYERTSQRYGLRGERYVHLEVGHLIQNVKLQSKVLGIDIEYILDFNQTTVGSYLQTDHLPLLVCLAWNTSQDHLGNQKHVISVEKAINNRRSIRDYKSTTMSKKQLEGLLTYSIYNKVNNTLIIEPLLSELPVNVYISISDVDEYRDGVYQYNVTSQELNLKLNESKSQEIYDASLQQNWVISSPIRIIMTLNTNQLPIDVNYYFGEIETGRVAQNFYLVSQAYSLGMVVVGAFHDSQIRSILSLPIEEHPLYVIPVGVVDDEPVLTLIQINLDTWSALLGWIAALLFYCSALIKTEPVRGKIPKSRLLHLLTGIFSGISGLLHIILGHGGWHTLTSPTYFRLRSLYTSAVGSLSYGEDSNLYNLIIDTIRIGFWSGLIFGILSILSYFAVIKNPKWVTHILHRYLGHLILISMILHSIINGSFFHYFEPFSVIFVLLAMIVYLALYNFNFTEKSLIAIRKKLRNFLY